MAQKLKDTILNPILKGNPITVLILGICSSLAVTVQLKGALVMALIFNMFAKFSRPDGVYWQVHELIVGDWRVCAACGCMFFLFSLRYWHYSFLRLKYIAELYQKMHGKSASQPENAAKP